MKRKLMQKWTKNAKNAIEIIAQREGLTVEELRAEITEAMTVGQNNPNPQVRAFWDMIPRAEKEPTPEELIAFLAHQATVNKTLTAITKLQS